jgi:hypothetical protein
MADIVVCGDLEGEIEKSGELSKLEALGFLAGLLVNGTDLLARVAAQGFEPALLATAVEHSAGVRSCDTTPYYLDSSSCLSLRLTVA